MIRTYGIAATTNLKPLALPPMTLKEAESIRQSYADMGQTVHIINLRSE